MPIPWIPLRFNRTLSPHPGERNAADVPRRFKVDAYPAREAHGFIWMYWGEAEDAPEDLPFFDDLEGFHFTTFRDHWPMHYSRCIENQLDVMHLPFVHATTIGRGGKTLVEGPIVRWLGEDNFRFYVFNRPDTGQLPRKVGELSIEESPVHLDFLFPNIWQNHISAKMRIVAAFAPIDEENTLIYLRLYQRIITLPILRSLLTIPLNLFNKIILGQDRRVVITQRPVATSLKMGELLVEGDRPIVEYRRRRQELMDEARPKGAPQQDESLLD